MSNCTNKFALLHPMLQYGNAPTAWNASSGDYLTQESAKSLFSQTADEIKTEVTKSVTETVTANVKDTATSAANDAVDSKLQDYATTATVNSLKEDVSSISQKANNISINCQQFTGNHHEPYLIRPGQHKAGIQNRLKRSCILRLTRKLTALLRR